MARANNLQAISLNYILDFNFYIYNVQADYVFDYHNGTAKIDRNMVVNH